LDGKGQEVKIPALISMEEVEEKEVEWLIPQYMPKGHISILAGDGGIGKTTIWCGIAAALSSGSRVFFEAVPEEFVEREPQKIIFFSSEDSMEYTLKAKFRKYNANMRNIFSISIKGEEFKDIKFNSPILRGLVEKERPALVVFDPIQSFVPPNMNMGKRNEMRDCLNCLRELGEEFGCTFLIVCHTNKQSGVYGRKRIADSADIWDIARPVLVAGETNDNKRYLSQEKNSYDQEAETVIYTVNDGIAVFEEYSDKKDRDFIQERDYNTRQASQRADAEHFIYEFLRNGRKPTKELDEAAEAAGISKVTLKRAKTDLRNRTRSGRFKTGGFPEDGWFRASHREIMGQFDNGQSVVANNEQITNGIAIAVQEANKENNMLMRQELSLLQRQNDLLMGILEKETGISKGDIFNAVKESDAAFRKRTGRSAFAW